MSTSVLVDRFEQARARASGSVDARRRALDAFLANGFPTRRNEAWKYTDLRPIAEGDFEAPPATVTDRAHERVAALLSDAAPGGETSRRIVLIDGRFDESLSRIDGPPGLDIKHLDYPPELDVPRLDNPPEVDVPRPDGPLGQNVPRPNRPLGQDVPRGGGAHAAGDATRQASASAHPLALLNRAFASDALTIRAAADFRAERPLELYLIASGEARIAQHPSVVIELAPHARLDLTIRCIGGSDTESWVNFVVDVTQSAGSRLTMHRLQEHGDAVHHTSLLTAQLGRDASLVASFVDLGGSVVRNDVDVRLVEPGASADVFGVFVATPGRHVDDEIHIEHAARETRSDTAFRGIAASGGRGVFRGKLLVQPDAQKIDARQKSDNLLLGDRAEIDTRPELEIYADDVKCSHGATVGEIDAEQLFYLRSRGVDEESARGLLTFAFANDLLRRLEPQSLRERATRCVAGQLPTPPAWEEAR